MKQFEEKKFNIPKLVGISEKNIEEHLKLYSGYVKNANELLGKEEYDRRFPFEFNGMRNHEVYFSQFEGGPQGNASVLPGFDLDKFKALALTRGVGWAMVYYDPNSQQIIQSWVDEQHLGQLSQCVPVLALDMWEHSFVADYQPSGKKQYVEDFFTNLNWSVVEKNLAEATK